MIAESAFIRWKADGNLRSKGQGDLFVLKNYDVKKKIIDVCSIFSTSAKLVEVR